MAKTNYWTGKFDRDRDFIVRREITIDGVKLLPGQPFDKELVTTRRLRQLFDNRTILFADTAKRTSLVDLSSQAEEELETNEESAENKETENNGESSPADETEAEGTQAQSDQETSALDHAPVATEVESSEAEAETEQPATEEPEEPSEGDDEETSEPDPEEETKAEEEPLIEIPDYWKGMHWSQKAKLASEISGTSIKNGTDADAVIIAELERRNGTS